MKIAVKILWDSEASVWVAICNEIGLSLESGSYDALLERIRVAVPEMLELNGFPPCSSIGIVTEDRQVAIA